MCTSTASSSSPAASSSSSSSTAYAAPCAAVPFSPADDPRSLAALLLSLRVLLLSHISDIEARIPNFDSSTLSTLFGAWDITLDVVPPSPSASGRHPGTDCEPDVDVLNAILALLDSFRADVRRHLPDIDFDLPSLPEFDFALPNLSAIHVPDSILASIRAHSPSLPTNFIPSVKRRLHELSALAAPPARLTRLLSFFDSVPLVMDELAEDAPEGKGQGRKKEREDESSGSSGEDELVPLIHRGKTAKAAEIVRALAASANGDRLITFADLPFRWRNNEYVHTGYRFVPAARWPLLLCSVFQWHNETINILSHLLPTVLLPLLSVVPLGVPALPTAFWPSWLDPPTVILDPLPRYYFWAAAGCCLACSVLWHTLNGCSDHPVCEWAARVDYVGIGWLISASITSAIYYGFYCDPHTASLYAAFSVLTGVLGSILPFMHWFNQRKNKKWRIAFFVTCALSALLFVGHLALERGVQQTLDFYAPIFPSVAAYTFGLIFYAWHFPECAFPGKFDYLGASHQIWHISIVAAIWLHYRAIASWHVGAVEYACPAPL